MEAQAKTQREADDRAKQEAEAKAKAKAEAQARVRTCKAAVEQVESVVANLQEDRKKVRVHRLHAVLCDAIARLPLTSHRLS
jgi:hypothetical protein